jgi:hypothetical protein
MYVFRSERRLARGKDLLAGLRDAISSNAPAAQLDALLRAGELECALADANTDDEQLALASTLTDGLAARLLKPPDPSADLLKIVDRLQTSERLCIAKPEGFAYYCLHPLDYALLADSVSAIPRAAVIGLRSIGTTLSAVTAAAMRSRGISADRITVRPHGHPFDRRYTFDGDQLHWVRARLEASANFLVVDEGPGLSGSSLLSVGEALVAAGVPRGNITFFCSHQPDPERLCAHEAARRWRSFRSHAVPFGNRKPEAAGLWLGAGLWRNHILSTADLSSENWPASWTQVEHAKYLSGDGAALHKFEGLGRYGEEVVSRSQQLAELGFGPRLVRPLDEQGYAGYQRIAPDRSYAERFTASQLTEGVLQNLARYCAMRGQEFACDLPQVAPGEVSLEEMCCVNASEEFEVDIHPSAGFLPCERPVIADARMMPHEWISTTTGSMVKTDGTGHGDDHFFPGPCDIAWDLAGAIIEWRLGASAAEFFLQSYQRLSGDNAGSRLPQYLLAYSLFRMGYSKMAGEAMQGSNEEPRLKQAFEFYRGVAGEQFCRRGFAVDLAGFSPITSKTRQPSPQRSAVLLPSVQRT